MKSISPMWQRIPFYASLICSANFCTAQTSTPDSIKYSQQLIRIEQSLMNAVAYGDTFLWKKYLSNDFFIVTEDGTRFERKDFLSTFGPLPKGYSGRIDVIKPKVTFHQSAAVMSYVADEYETVFGQKIHTTYGTMNTYIKTDTSWQMIASQVYEIPQLPPAIKLSAGQLKKFTGIYQLSDSNKVYITMVNDTLYYQRNNRAKRGLFAETENIFFTLADTRGRKIFTTDDGGKMILLERRNGQDVVWKKIQ